MRDDSSFSTRRGAYVLERDNELQMLAEALLSARAGAGLLAIVEGAAGIGKTALLRLASARARDDGALVLSAAGAELERSFPFGVVRQLFEPLLAGSGPQTRRGLLSGAAALAARVVDPRRRVTSGTVDASGVLHGLYWLTANLAEKQPVVLVVDDAHWSDAASLEWLSYLARRIGDLRVLAMFASRPSEPGADEGLLNRLRGEVAMRLQPAPLTTAAVKQMAADALGTQVGEQMASACREATGGNPFFITQLLSMLESAETIGPGTGVDEIAQLGATAVSRAVLARLARMGEHAIAVGGAVAVLEPQAELRHVAAIARIDRDAAAVQADALLEVGMFSSVDPCRFAHPILRAAVEADLKPARRGLLHAHAAELLSEAGGPLGAVAAHLIQCPPAGSPDSVAKLRKAAAEAIASGVPSAACTYLERALAEPPPANERGAVLMELGVAEGRARRSEAVSHLRRAIQLAETPAASAVASLELGRVLWFSGEMQAAHEVAVAAADTLAFKDEPLALELEALILGSAFTAGRMDQTEVRARQLDGSLKPRSPGACSVIAQIGFRGLVKCSPSAEVSRRAEAGLFDGSLTVAIDQGATTDAAGVTFIWLDELERADALYTRALDVARGVGSAVSIPYFSAVRGYLRHRSGELLAAEVDLEAALGADPADQLPFALLVALIAKVLLLVDRGEAAAGEQLAQATPVPTPFEQQPVVAMLRHAQGVAQLAQHRFDDAAQTLARVGDTLGCAHVLTPALAPWRSDLALALAALGHHDDALRYAEEELELAQRADIDRCRGIALRALGLLAAGDRQIALLDEAAQTLARSAGRLEHARSLVELGSALRRANRRREARDPLRRGLDIAHRCAALGVVERARTELEATGARPRKLVLSGAESLTPSERRIAQLASEGHTNVQIAQALFLSVKTVETHLRSTYNKLCISSRADLRTALSEPLAA
jgi:DNA-binding CsgD family transcriptional regulator